MPRICELNWSAAVFLCSKCGGAVLVDCFEKVFGNKTLRDCVYILMIYAVYELCLTLEGVRIFIWPCNWN